MDPWVLLSVQWPCAIAFYDLAEAVVSGPAYLASEHFLLLVFLCPVNSVCLITHGNQAIYFYSSFPDRHYPSCQSLGICQPASTVTV